MNPPEADGKQDGLSRGQGAGLSMADVITLPAPLRKLVTWMMRREEVSLAEVAAFIQGDEPAGRAMMDSLLAKGFVRAVQTAGSVRYRVRLAPIRGHTPMFDRLQAVDDKVADNKDPKSQP